MQNDFIHVYGVTWCGDCRRAMRFFDLNNIHYQWTNIDHDRSGEEFVIRVNKGFRSVPTIVFPDGSILVEPSNDQLAVKIQAIRDIMTAPKDGSHE